MVLKDLHSYSEEKFSYKFYIKDHLRNEKYYPYSYLEVIVQNKTQKITRNYDVLTIKK